jgi:hypothetical protein
MTRVRSVATTTMVTAHASGARPNPFQPSVTSAAVALATVATVIQPR